MNCHNVDRRGRRHFLVAGLLALATLLTARRLPWLTGLGKAFKGSAREAMFYRKERHA